MKVLGQRNNLWFDQLPKLNAILIEAGFSSTPDRWLNVTDLLVGLQASGQLPQSHEQLRYLLAPLFCRSEHEQQAFSQLIQQWWQDHCVAKTKVTEAQRSTKEEPLQPSAYGWRRYLLRNPYWGLVIIFAIVLLLQQLNGPPQATVERPVVIQESSPPDAVNSVAIDTASPKPDITIKPVPPRQPPETNIGPIPQPVHKWISFAIRILDFGLPVMGLIFALFLLWLRYRARIALRRKHGDIHQPLAKLAIHPDDDDLFDGPWVRSGLRRLHTPVNREVRALDVAKTVDATVRQGGLFEPVRALRATVPELMIWVDCRSSEDALLGLAQTLEQRLQEMHLVAVLFSYRGNPQYLLDHSTEQWHSMDSVLSMHGGSRLILVGQGQGLIDLWSGKPLPWLRQVQQHCELLLLETTSSEPAWVLPLREAGILVAPLNSQGIGSVSHTLTHAQSTSQDQTQRPGDQQQNWSPPPLLRDRELLQQPIALPAAQRQRLYAALQFYLGTKGLHLLCAAAAYPALHWALLRQLDLQLYPHDDPDLRELRLLRLAQLCWARDGWMPDWIRRLLLRSLTAAQLRQIQAVYNTLLEQGMAAKGDLFNLKVHLPANDSNTKQVKSLRQRMRHYFLNPPKAGALKDGVFAQLMLGGRLDLLSFKLPPALSRTLINTMRNGWRFTALILVLATAIGLASHGAWQYWGRPWLAQQGMPHGQGPLPIAFEFNENNTALANALLATLGDQIKQVEGINKGEVDQAEMEANALNINYQPGWQQAANWLAQRLSYLSYGAKINVVQADWLSGVEPVMQVQLFQDSPTGTVFHDQLKPWGKGQMMTQFDQLHSAPRDRNKNETTFQDDLKIGGKGPVMVALPGGTFTMGTPENERGRQDDEGPQHQASIARFAIGQTEVTFDQYQRFAKATKRKLPDDEGWGTGLRPVIDVTWQDATDYANWLSQQTGAEYRLPSEAEWEYAARAGTKTRFNTGDCITLEQANISDSSSEYFDCPQSGVSSGKTVEVAQYPPNGFDLYDMHGNVLEWVQDCWHDNYQNAPRDGSAWRALNGGDCEHAVVRGGSWLDLPENLRSGNRFKLDTDGSYNNVGFRVARTLE